MRFTISRSVAAPAAFVADWWLAHGPGRQEPAPDLRRTVRDLPTGQTRMILEGTVGSRSVRHDGVLTREGPTRWTYRTEVWSNDHLLVREQAVSEVQPEGDGARLTTTFDVLPVGRFHRFVFWSGTGNLRRRREEAYDRLVATLERAYVSTGPTR